MVGSEWLKRYYLSNAEQSCKMLECKQLKFMLWQKNLILFLRYLQNLISLDNSSFLKTLLLAFKLIKLDSQKIRLMFPHIIFYPINLTNKVSDKENSLFKIISNKLLFYIQKFIKEQVSAEQQLQLLTVNMNHFKIGSHDPQLLIFAQFFYAQIEEICYQFWLSLQKRFGVSDELEDQQFQTFYRQYSIFCDSRRKIPKIKNKNLKNVQISINLNKKLQLRHFSLNHHKQTCAQNTFLKLQPRGLSKIMALMQDCYFDDE